MKIQVKNYFSFGIMVYLKNLKEDIVYSTLVRSIDSFVLSDVKDATILSAYRIIDAEELLVKNLLFDNAKKIDFLTIDLGVNIIERHNSNEIVCFDYAGVDKTVSLTFTND